MDYQKHYFLLIERAKNRTLPETTYAERHHIVPKCMGGGNAPENIARLTAEEHYIAHQLLAKMYPHNHKLIYAVKIMTHGPNRKNNKLYGWVRRKITEALKGREMSPEWRKRIGVSKIGKHYSLGLVRSEETLRRMSESKKGIPSPNKGIPSPNKGIPLSEEHKEKLRKPKSEEHKQKLREANLRPETNARLREINKGRIVTDEQKRKQSEAMKGRPSPRKGVTLSEETRQKISETKKRRNEARRNAKNKIDGDQDK